MPFANNRAGTNEHLIFVKNVPQYLAKDEVPKRFIQYNSIGVKNVYPHSHITTVVISFAAKHEAERAQRETDQMRLDNVVLRVEGYNKGQSVRYLRDKGHASRPLGAVEEDDTGNYEEDTQEEASIYIPPLEPVVVKYPKIASQGTTWAHIAGKQRGAVQPAVPAVQEAEEKEEEDNEATPPKTPTFTPRLPTAVPDITWTSKIRTSDEFPSLMGQNSLLPTPPNPQPAVQEAEKEDEQNEATPPKTPTSTPRLPIAVPDITWTSKIRTSNEFPPLMAQNPLLPTPPDPQPPVPPTLPTLTEFLNTLSRSIQTPLSASRESEGSAHVPGLPSSSNRTIVPAPPKTPDNAQSEDDDEQMVKMENVSGWANERTGVQASVWEPIDTTERIRHFHCRDCWFCKRRLQSWMRS
jgi:hypothetical protein